MTTRDATAERSNRSAWAVIAAILVLDLVWLAFSTVSVVPLSLATPVLIGIALTVAGQFYRRRRGEPRLADALDVFGQTIAFMAVGGLFSYLAATLRFPLQDASFHAWDRAIGLDWRGYLRFVNDRPLLGQLYSLAYASILPQVLVLLIGLCFTGRGEVARHVVLAMILAGFVTIAMSGFLPAMAMFVQLGLTQADFDSLEPAAAFVHVSDMEALRSGRPVLVDLGKVEGIITFPSYHAALGLLFLLAGWAHPVLRWPFATLNLTMIAATPIDGGHYFVDVLAGLAIAASCWLLVRYALAGSTAATMATAPLRAPALADR